MHIKISNKIIKSFDSESDLLNIITDENEELPIKEWIEKYRSIISTKDIVWLLLRNEFLSDKDLRLFAVWCAREALKLIENPDKRSVEACNVAEKYANGEATIEELLDASDAAFNFTYATACAAIDATLADTYAGYPYTSAIYATSAAFATANYYATKAAYYAACNAAFALDNAASVVYDAANYNNYDIQLNQLLTYFEWSECI